MAMTSTGCAGMRPSSLRADGCLAPAVIFARSSTNPSALGECADAAEDHPPYLCSGRYLVPKLPRSHLGLLSWTSTTRVSVVHGHQQLAQWNAHYDERCFLPIHVYDEATGAPVTVIPPSGVEVRKLLSRRSGASAGTGPTPASPIRGDGHYDFIEHPELIANRISNYAKLVGRENVIAGSLAIRNLGRTSRGRS